MDNFSNDASAKAVVPTFGGAAGHLRRKAVYGRWKALGTAQQAVRKSRTGSTGFAPVPPAKKAPPRGQNSAAP